MVSQTNEQEALFGYHHGYCSGQVKVATSLELNFSVRMDCQHPVLSRLPYSIKLHLHL
jgi:hypothetical protein